MLLTPQLRDIAEHAANMAQGALEGQPNRSFLRIRPACPPQQHPSFAPLQIDLFVIFQHRLRIERHQRAGLVAKTLKVEIQQLRDAGIE